MQGDRLAEALRARKFVDAMGGSQDLQAVRAKHAQIDGMQQHYQVSLALVFVAIGGILAAARIWFRQIPVVEQPGAAAATLCGGDGQWHNIATQMYESHFKLMPNPVLWSCTSEVICRGIGDRHRGMVFAFHASLLADRPLLIYSNEQADLTNFLIPKTVLWNVTDVPGAEDVIDFPQAEYEPTAFESIQHMRKLRYRMKKTSRPRPSDDVIWYSRTPSKIIDTRVPNITEILAKAERVWETGMPMRVRKLHESLRSMNNAMRNGCVWHFLFRFSAQLEDSIAESLFEVAQKSDLLPSEATLEEELDRAALREFFARQYGNLSRASRTTMEEAMTTLFPRTVGSDFPVFVAVHLRQGGASLRWSREPRRTSPEVTRSIVPCAIEFGNATHVRVLFASDNAKTRVVMQLNHPEVITLSISDAPSHVLKSHEGSTAYVQVYTEMAILSFADRFVGTVSGFGQVACSMGLFPATDVILARSTQYGPSEEWLNRPALPFSACNEDYRGASASF
eukprot:Polyplicarium_translucidae@DN1104_c0_g1_i2.p1